MRRGVALLLALGTSISGSAHAWDGVCLSRFPIEGPNPTDGIAFYEANICQPQTTLCKEGVEFPRGIQAGEHALLASIAMSWAGLASYTTRPTTGQYYSDGKPFFTVPGSKLTPAGTGSMIEAVPFRRALPEFAEVPDASYGLSDFIMGNEHCLAHNVPGFDFDQIQACHEYAGHLAVVNSTHFAPQNSAMYGLYHGIALAIADRCKKMKDVKQGHLLANTFDRQIADCEREALSFEAVGAHFVGDAWSIGHMWQRWGAPVFAFTRPDQLVQAAVGAVSGLIHGWRSLARPLFGGQITEHDQLCMPGFFEFPDPATEGQRFAKAVRWAYPPGTELPPSFDPVATEYGGGDLYLLKCTALRTDPRWSVAPPVLGPFGQDTTARPLSTQYRRMMTCMALGFEEVYRAGPMLAGEVMRAVPADNFDPAIKSSRDPACWSQRATNQSMRLGAGISNVGSFTDPELLGRVQIRARSLELAVVRGTVGLANFNAALSALGRLYLVDLGKAFVRRAERNAKGTDAADLTLISRDLFGFRPNSAYVDVITGGRVNYLERADPTRWTVEPTTQVCATDADCSEEVQPGPLPTARRTAQYCDPTAVDGNGVLGPKCVPHESALLRAFRSGEAPYFCGADRKPAIEHQRRECVASGSRRSMACDACVEVLLPHLRNACQRDGPVKGHERSMCDLYQEAGLLPAGTNVEDGTYYTSRPYTTEFEAMDRARDICFSAGDSACAIDATEYRYSFSASAAGEWHCGDPVQFATTAPPVEGVIASCPGSGCLSDVTRTCPPLEPGTTCPFALTLPTQYAAGELRGLVTRIAPLDYRIDVSLDLRPTIAPSFNMPDPALCNESWAPTHRSVIDYGFLIVDVPTGLAGKYRIDVTTTGNLESALCAGLPSTPATGSSIEVRPISTCAFQEMGGRPMPVTCTASEMVDTFGDFIRLGATLSGSAQSFLTYDVRTPIPCDRPNSSTMTMTYHLEPL